MDIQEINAAILDTVDIEKLKSELSDEYFTQWQYKTSLEKVRPSLKKDEKESERIDAAKRCTMEHFGFKSWDEVLMSDMAIDYFNDAKDKLSLMEASGKFKNSSPYVPIDLLNFIYGDNPKQKVYFKDDFKSISQLIEYLNTEPHKTELSKLNLTIPEKMAYMFGDDWDNDNNNEWAHEWGHDNNIPQENKNMTEKTSPEVLPSIEVNNSNHILLNTKKSDNHTKKNKKQNIISTHLSTEDDYYEMVNHPSHYNHYDKEAIDMMVDIWGKENTALWCKMTAFKYRLRMGTKPDSSLEQDFNKEKWYLKKANELLQDD